MSDTTHADLGGRPGFGPVSPEPEGELFHAAWEPRALALTLAMGATGSWNIDTSRRARETLPNYAALSYYAIWLDGLERLLAERGLVSAAELGAATAQRAALPALPALSAIPALPIARVLKAADVLPTLARGSPTARTVQQAARFQVGQPVRTRSEHVAHHTRLPGYAHDKLGIIERVHGAHVFADTNAQSQGEQPQWLYTVVFDGRELWGPDAAQGSTVSVDAWESYLTAAE